MLTPELMISNSPPALPAKGYSILENGDTMDNHVIEHCPKCGRELEWYATGPDSGHGEPLWTMPDGSKACGDCTGNGRTICGALKKLHDSR